LPRAGSETILFFEDDEVVRRFACDALSTLGYNVFEASSGMNALSLVKEIDLTVDLLITDLIMPGMNGKELGYEGSKALVICRTVPPISSVFFEGYYISARTKCLS